MINNFNSEQFKNPETGKVNNYKNPCKCEGERLIHSTNDSDYFCVSCGGYTEKKGMKVHADYGFTRKILW